GTEVILRLTGNRYLDSRNGWESYGEFQENMEDLGWDIHMVPYDWRRRGDTEAPKIRARIASLIGTSNFHLVGHSEGTRHARWLWKNYNDSGDAGQIKTVVDLAPPSLGAWEIVRLMYG